jgi:hypothetical protein
VDASYFANRFLQSNIDSLLPNPLAFAFIEVFVAGPIFDVGKLGSKLTSVAKDGSDVRITIRLEYDEKVVRIPQLQLLHYLASVLDALELGLNRLKNFKSNRCTAVEIDRCLNALDDLRRAGMSLNWLTDEDRVVLSM